MKPTKRQIHKLKTALRKAEKAEELLHTATSQLCELIIESTGLEGNVDHLTGDGFGFTPASNDRTHIAVDELIKLAESGLDITEEEIPDRLVF